MVFRKYIIPFLALVCGVVWLTAIQNPDSHLEIVACDVGQGDAILIQHESDQILIDGGPNSTVLDCLGEYMPYWDREIELVILTHPEKDHYGGLIDVFNAYKVNSFLTNDLSGDKYSSQGIEVLRNKVGGGDVKVLYPDVGLKLRVGLIYLDVLHPSGGYEGRTTNDLSIVTLLKYDDFEAILTGDIEDKVSDTIAQNWEMGHVDYIKVPHHGSKNGISQDLLAVTMPKIAVISVGAKNSFGHPHKEVLDLLEKYTNKVLRTDQLGSVVVKTDGDKINYPD